MFHYYADEKIIEAYKNTAGTFKNVLYHRQFKKLGLLFRYFVSMFKPIFKVLINYRTAKNISYKFAHFTPLIFKHTPGKTSYNIFQTLEMVDFKKSLAPANLNLLIKEKGAFIAHTYFSAPMAYHHGRMFKSPDVIDEDVASNFKYLGEMIANQEIWNPTLDQLSTQLMKFYDVTTDVDQDGKVMVTNSAGLLSRTVD